MSNKVSPFELDSYKSRSERVDHLNKPDNVYAKAWVSNLVVLGCTFIDFYCLQVVWNLIQTEDHTFIYAIAIACAIALDVPLAIAAIRVKRYDQGLCSKREKNIVLFLALAVFLTAFIFSFAFRVCTRDLSFDTGTGSTVTDTLSSGQEADTASTVADTLPSDQEADTGSDDVMILVAAIFNGIIPLFTSIASYLLSYCCYDPLGIKLKNLAKERIELQANVIEAKQALAEAGTVVDYCDGLIARENDLYEEFMEQLDSDAMVLEQKVRLIAEEKIGTPEAVTEISRSSEEAAQKYPMTNTPGQKLPEHVDRLNQKKEEAAADPADPKDPNAEDNDDADNPQAEEEDMESETRISTVA